MVFESGTSDPAAGPLGMVELCASYENDRGFNFYSKAEWREYLNLAQLAVAAEINRLYEAYFLKSTTIDTTAGTAVYSMPTDLAKLLGVDIGATATDDEAYQLREIQLPQREFYRGLGQVNARNEHGFFFVQGTQIRLNPVPGVTGNKLIFYYVQRVLPLVNPTDVSIIPVDWHELIVFRAVQRAASKKNRPNIVIDRLEARTSALMTDAIPGYSFDREETVEPWLPDEATAYPWPGP